VTSVTSGSDGGLLSAERGCFPDRLRLKIGGETTMGLGDDNRPGDSVLRDEYEASVRKLVRWAQAYYVHDAPIVSDATYDRLFREVADVEAAHPEWTLPNSPTQRVGGDVLPGFQKARHPQPLLSLANVFDSAGVEAFDRRVGIAAPDATVDRYVVEPKLDGLTLALLYIEGALVQAATRGDGEVGENVTSQALTIRTVPVRLNEVGGTSRYLMVRGEVTLPRDAFARLNEARENAGEPLYQNPRNAAAGSVRQLDPKVTGARDLRFTAYALTELEELAPKTPFDGAEFEADVQEVVNAAPVGNPEVVARVIERLGAKMSRTGSCRSHWDVLQALGRLGFRVNVNARESADLEELSSTLDALQGARSSWDEETDGLVVKVNDLAAQERLGVAGKDPRWAIAYKVSVSEVAVTKLLDIAVQVGRTGAVTPLAVLAPVRLGGVTVASATLHNADQVRSLDLRVGDWVRVERAGGVIPAVLGVDGNGARRDGSESRWEFPTTCPACGGTITRDDDEVVARCAGMACPAQRSARIRHFASRGAVDIAGLGANWIDRLIEAGMVAGPADLYHLTAAQLRSFEGQGMGDILAAKLAESIDRTRTTTALGRFLFGLGIRHVGAETASLLGPVVKSLDALRAALHSNDPENRVREYEARAIETRGIGPVVARSFAQALTDPTMIAQLDRFADGRMVPIPVEAATEGPSDGPLSGKTVVLTGTMTQSRDAIAALVVQAGGKVTDSVSGATTYVVAGEKAGVAKIKGAARHGVAVISEERLRDLLRP
jgi:DNA ligase (NAD+)